MIQLGFSVSGQLITRTDNNRIVSDSRGVISAKFTFSADWAGLVKTAVFRKGTVEASAILIDYVCTVPDTVMVGIGILTVSVFANSGETVRYTANVANVSVEQSGYKIVDPAPPSDPDQDYIRTLAGDYGVQMLRFTADNNIEGYDGTTWHVLLLDKTTIETIRDAIEQYATNAAASEVAAKASETAAKTSETNAKASETNAAGSAVLTAQLLSDAAEAEQARIDGENERVSAESGRASAESARVQAEALRENTVAAIEAAYAPRLTNVESGLQNASSELAAKANQSDLNITNNNVSFKAEKSYVDAKFGTLAGMFTFKGSDTWANISAKTGMATNDCWYDTTNSGYVAYNGTTWVTNIGSISLGDGTVTPSKTSFVTPSTKYPQLVDINNIVTGKWLTFNYNSSDYNVMAANANYNVSNLITFETTGSHVVRTNIKINRLVTYKTNMLCEETYSYANATDNGDGTYTFTIPTNRPHIRFDYGISGVNAGKTPIMTLSTDWSSSIDGTKYGYSTPVLHGIDLEKKSVKLETLEDNLQLKISSISVPSTNPCDYNGDEICMLSKGVLIGDSLTAGAFDHNEGGTTQGFIDTTINYVANLTRLTGLALTNLGSSGATCASWYTAHQNDNLSGYKFAIIALGVNDAYFNNGWTINSDTAITNIVTKLRNESPGIKIFITTPPMYFNGTIFDSVRAGVADIATSLSLYLIDFGTYLTEFSVANATKIAVTTFGHFNAYGYYKLAKAYKAYISYIIANNNADFKNLQFVGTTYLWT